MALVVTKNVNHQVEDFGLDPHAVELLWRMEDDHFWHRARNKWIHRALLAAGVRPPARILEVGCGSGAVARFLLGLGYRVTGVDTAEHLVRKAHERCPEGTFFVADVGALPTDERFQVIAFCDVLEHLDEPLRLMEASRRHVDAGALYLATVPAQAALHTVIDDLSGHKRRFEVGQLAELFREFGLEDVDERGIFRTTAVFQRLLRSRLGKRRAADLTDADRAAAWRENFQIPSLLVNHGLGWLCAIERVLGFGSARRRAGASLIATGRLVR